MTLARILFGQLTLAYVVETRRMCLRVGHLHDAQPIMLPAGMVGHLGAPDGDTRARCMIGQRFGVTRFEAEGRPPNGLSLL